MRWVIGCLLALLVVAAPAAAREPVHVHTESLLPALVRSGDRPGRLAECAKPRIACVDAVIRRLRRRADKLGCDHRAVFARNYQRLTEVLRSYIARPDFFSDRKFLDFEDVLFARLFFNAYDGRYVPEAWRIAFASADSGDSYAITDLLLGINAHVQRDMPYVVATMQLGRKSDHDRVNEVLDDAYERITREVIDRYDDSTAVFASPLTPVDDIMGIELVRGWREGVWRNAEALLNAHTPQERAAVDQRIELNAATSARLLSQPGPPGHRAARDAYCASRRS